MEVIWKYTDEKMYVKFNITLITINRITGKKEKMKIQRKIAKIIDQSDDVVIYTVVDLV